MAFSIPNEADAFHPNQAEVDKIDFDILAAGYERTGVISGCAVTAQATPDMTVAVAAGTVSVLNTQATVTAGNVTITAAHATNPRFDLVVVSNTGVKSVTAGTAAADPVFPAIPANSVVLASVYVPAADTTIEANQIRDKRVLLSAAYQALSDYDAKGDLIVGTGADAKARRAVGANGTVLTADSAEATGVKWAVPAGGFVGAQVYRATDQVIPDTTFTEVSFSTEVFDSTADHWVVGSPTRFTAKAAGKYRIDACVQWYANGTGKRVVAIRKNGATYMAFYETHPHGTNNEHHYTGKTLNLALNDYVEIMVSQTSGGNLSVVGGESATWAEMVSLGA